MEPFKTLHAIACPLAHANMDTDRIIPARFLSRPREAGYGDVLFHDLRTRTDGSIPVFPLDRPPWKDARILVARRNFAAGSSREAAVYALLDFGIRAVVAPSFSDIFTGNAVANGLLPAIVAEDTAERLLTDLTTGDSFLGIDLQAQTIRHTAGRHLFEIDPVHKLKLLNGWDDIDLTDSYAAEIDRYFAADAKARPWARVAR
ncbi:MAG: 3-isopropylmalate dehydratase small subunit [Hyphomicrobiaceae bacterium]